MKHGRKSNEVWQNKHDSIQFMMFCFKTFSINNSSKVSTFFWLCVSQPWCRYHWNCDSRLTGIICSLAATSVVSFHFMSQLTLLLLWLLCFHLSYHRCCRLSVMMFWFVGTWKSIEMVELNGRSFTSQWAGGSVVPPAIFFDVFCFVWLVSLNLVHSSLSQFICWLCLSSPRTADQMETKIQENDNDGRFDEQPGLDHGSFSFFHDMFIVIMCWLFGCVVLVFFFFSQSFFFFSFRWFCSLLMISFNFLCHLCSLISFGQRKRCFKLVARRIKAPCHGWQRQRQRQRQRFQRAWCVYLLLCVFLSNFCSLLRLCCIIRGVVVRCNEMIVILVAVILNKNVILMIVLTAVSATMWPPWLKQTKIYFDGSMCWIRPFQLFLFWNQWTENTSTFWNPSSFSRSFCLLFCCFKVFLSFFLSFILSFVHFKTLFVNHIFSFSYLKKANWFFKVFALVRLIALRMRFLYNMISLQKSTRIPKKKSTRTPKKNSTSLLRKKSTRKQNSQKKRCTQVPLHLCCDMCCVVCCVLCIVCCVGGAFCLVMAAVWFLREISSWQIQISWWVMWTFACWE